MQHLAAEGFQPTAIVHTEGVLLPWLEQHAVKVVRANLPFVSAKERGLSDVPALVWNAVKLAHFLRESDFSIVHANDGRMIASWMPAARLATVAGIAHRRTVWGNSRLALLALRSATKVVAISNYVRDSLPGSVKIRSTVVLNPLDAKVPTREQGQTVVRQLVGSDAPVVAFVGTLQEQKQPGIFIEAAARIHQQRSDVRFLMVGREGALGRQLSDKVRDLGLSYCLTFTGFRPDAWSLIAGSDMLVAPAINEGHGRTLMEAMLCGVPIVAAASGGHHEIITNRETGILVEPGRPEAFAQAALQLLGDSGARLRLSSAGLAWAREHASPATHAAAIAAIYRECLA
jgi:glycosyltransferase involved in cell wall biosynthesis